jgi:spore coat protein A
MAGLYLIRDDVEDALNLPKGEFEVPLVLMDRLITKEGQLYYPVSQVASAPWIAEYFGNAVLVNGKLLPFLAVLPRQYRFRVLNASNARFYFLTLDTPLPLYQIGSDQGLLAAPVEMTTVSLAPGERADLLIDFSSTAGQSIVLNNQAARVMQFRVAGGQASKSKPPPPTLRSVPRLAETAAVVTRRLTLEQRDNLIDEPMAHLLDGKRWHDPVSETPKLGSIEIWEFLNLTDDTHPIHLHLVRFQILDRRSINIDEYVFNKKLIYLSPAEPPHPSEAGWKDTVRVTPGSSTRIIARFDGYAGRYVWHCHILEHEDNEMMRPFEVLAR